MFRWKGGIPSFPQGLVTLHSTFVLPRCVFLLACKLIKNTHRKITKLLKFLRMVKSQLVLSESQCSFACELFASRPILLSFLLCTVWYSIFIFQSVSLVCSVGRNFGEVVAVKEWSEGKRERDRGKGLLRWGRWQRRNTRAIESKDCFGGVPKNWQGEGLLARDIGSRRSTRKKEKEKERKWVDPSR